MKGQDMTQRTHGFTIIELLLAMSFVSVLLISVAVLSMNINTIYNRGVTFKELNQTGVEAIDDIERTMRSADVGKIRFINTGDSHRLCLGQYSYVWNDIDQINQPSGQTTFSGAGFGASDGQPVQLVRVSDPAQQYCSSEAPTTVTDVGNTTQLLAREGQRELYVHDFSVSPLRDQENPDGTSTGVQIPEQSVIDARRGLFTIKVTLGTSDPSQIDTTTDPQCRPPADVNAGDEYCAVNVFTTVVLVGNTYE